jgi:2-C-methyl-D-erythritol 4-phosphate cytidylyltransferase
MYQPSIHALIPAAGRSVRFGGTTLKQYAHLNGQPVIAHSMAAIARHPAIASVTVALAEDDGIYEQLVGPDWPGVRTVIGGDSRARTVMNGLEAILNRNPDCEWVLVHDAARPCLELDALQRLITEGLSSDCGAILAVPVHDTLKLADDGNRIERTVDRSRMWGAQTPQFFRLAELSEHLARALDAGETPTDEAAAMEGAGLRPLLVTGSPTNIKITGTDDLFLAEQILNRSSLRE